MKASSGDSLFTRAGATIAGGSYAATAIADIDGMNGADLVVTGERPTGAKTKIYLREPDGGYRAAGHGLPGFGIGSVSVADVDGMAGPDLLLTGRDGNGTPTATLFLQQSDDSFQPGGMGLTGVKSSASSIADVDGKNGPDLLITGEDAGGTPTTTLYLQQSDGSFQPAGLGLTGVEGGSSSIVDVDGMNGPDLLVTGTDGTSSPTTTLYLQQLDGSFVAASAGLVDVGRGSSSSIGDVDGANGPDILVTGIGSTYRRTATLYLQQADGSFAKAGAGLKGVAYESTAIADLDGKNGPDLVITGSESTYRATRTLYFQQADGSFEQAGASLTPVFWGDVSVSDVDRDGDKDMLIAGNSDAFDYGTARLYVNRTQQVGQNRRPTVAQEVPSTSWAMHTRFGALVEFGDRDGDPLSLSLTQGVGAPDVDFTDFGNGTGRLFFTPDQRGAVYDFTITASDDSGASASESFTIRSSDVLAGSDAAIKDISAFGSSSVADVDGKHGMDLLVTGPDTSGEDTANLYLQQADGTFQKADEGLKGVDNATSSVADVDGKNGQDLLIVGEDSSGSETATLYMQQTDGSFQPAGADLVGVIFGSTAIADVDGKNGPDILIMGRDSTYSLSTTLYLQQSNGDFQPANAGLIPLADGAISIADVDEKHGPDILLSGLSATGGKSILYLQQSDGTFQEANAGLEGVYGASTLIRDVNGDGNADLLIWGETNNDEILSTLYVQGSDGTFNQTTSTLPDVRFGCASSADANGDGAVDVQIAGFGEKGGLFLQEPTGTFSRTDSGIPRFIYGCSTSTGDITGDGNPDALLTGFRRRFVNGTPLSQTSTLYRSLLSSAEAVSTQFVSGGGTVSFSGTGLTIDFGSGTSGEGPIRVVKYDRRPMQTAGLPTAETVSGYRFVVDGGDSLRIGDSTQIRFDVSTLDGTPTPGDIDVYRRDPPGLERYDLIPSSSVYGKVAEDAYDSASGHVVATVDSLGEFVFTSSTDPLPVELTSLQAEWIGESVRLTWRTSSKSHYERFVVQRRRSSDWRQIGVRESKGGVNGERAYHFRDRTVSFVADTTTYRLKTVATDGTVDFTDSVTVVRDAPTSVKLLGTYPNPAQNKVTVRYAVPGHMQGEAHLQLYDVLGRKVRTLRGQHLEGRRSETFDINGLPSGRYFLRLSVGARSRTETMTVVH